MSAAESENVRFLRAAFAGRLFEENPDSVLDVGTGGGTLLEQCHTAGLPCLGVEAHPRALADLRERGFDVLCAQAERLPFPDDAFDWVAMRHVPHHLRDPRAAFAEALRVARTGFLVAEPWFDTSFASQRNALAADRWLKSRHRAAGRLHGENFDASELAGLLPPGDWRLDCRTVLRLRDRDRGDWEADAAPWLAELAPAHPERAAYAQLATEIELGGLSFNGSLMLCVSPDSSPSLA